MAGVEIPSSVLNGRDRIEQGAAAATAELARLTAEYRDSPDQRAARARARLEELSNDPHFQNRALTSQRARDEQRGTELQLAAASREAEEVIGQLDSWDRVEMAFRDEPLPMVDTTVGDELSMRDLRSEVLDGRAKGLDTPVIEEGFLPNKNPPAVVAEARRRLEEHLGDRDWTAKLMAGDRDTSDEWAKLSRVARATEHEPPWSPRLR